jgi:hypothetical protein
MEVSQNIKNRTARWSNYPTPGYKLEVIQVNM